MENINYAIELNQIEENDDKIITAPSENPWTESTREFITLKKSLKNDYSDTVCGIIEDRAAWTGLNKCCIRKIMPRF